MVDRRLARRLAQQARAKGEPLGWFEQLYAAADHGDASVPWADLVVNPHLAEWPLLDVAGRRVLVVGCGYGDDAQWLAEHDAEVTAFDISPTAIKQCRHRFPASPVRYEVADLLDPPVGWLRARFDLVVECYTIQVLPPGSAQRSLALRRLAALTGHRLLLIARGRDDGGDEGAMPWPVSVGELSELARTGLTEVAFDDYVDDEEPPVRRFRATYERPPASPGT